MTEEEAKFYAVMSVVLKQDLELFTRYFFKARFGSKFILNWHHEIICRTLELVYAGKITRLIINIAPRFTKTEISVKNFIAKGFAINPASKFVHLSYSDTLVFDNSAQIKQIIQTEEYQAMFDVDIIGRSDRFWKTRQGGVMYCAPAGGQVTGFGAGAMMDEREFDRQIERCVDGIDLQKMFAGAIIIDDPVKPDDANSDAVRDKINERWDTTISSRVNSRNTPVIVTGQRLHPKDFCNHIMEQNGWTENLEEALADKSKWYVLKLPAMMNAESIAADDNKRYILDIPDVIEQLKDGSQWFALWKNQKTVEEIEAIDPIVRDTQYQQEPITKEGLMYSEFKTYDIAPDGTLLFPQNLDSLRKSYIDTADTGADNYMQIDYIENADFIYVLDLIYTNLPLKSTQIMAPEMLHKDKIDICRVESNNGGSQFCDTIESASRKLTNLHTQFIKFTQTQNKEKRIYDNSVKVTNLIVFPANWRERWPKFYAHVTTFPKDGKPKHDDPEDVLTGMVEYFGKDKYTGKSNLSNIASSFR